MQSAAAAAAAPSGARKSWVPESHGCPQTKSAEHRTWESVDSDVIRSADSGFASIYGHSLFEQSLVMRARRRSLRNTGRGSLIRESADPGVIRSADSGFASIDGHSLIEQPQLQSSASRAIRCAHMVENFRQVELPRVLNALHDSLGPNSA